MICKKQNGEKQSSVARAAWDAAQADILAWVEPLRFYFLVAAIAVLELSAWRSGFDLAGLRAQVAAAWVLFLLFLPFGIIFLKKKKNGGDTDFDPIGEAIEALPPLHQFIVCLGPIPFIALMISFVSFSTAPPTAPPRPSIAG